MNLHLIHSISLASVLAFSAFPAFAQDSNSPISTAPDSAPQETIPNSDNNASNDTLASESNTPIIDDALNVIPPKRSAKALELVNNPAAIEQIDIWIQNTTVDHPRNLILKDILLAMPLPVAGPRLVELSKKTQTPSIQESWSKWLSQFPEAYESVLRSWMKLIPPQSNQFYDLLTEYSKLNPDNAIDVWAQLISNFPARELGKVASFGLETPSCQSAITKRLLLNWQEQKSENPDATPDNPPILRLMSAYPNCHSAHSSPADVRNCTLRREEYSQNQLFPGNTSNDSANAISDIVDQLLNAAISRRIVAIDFCHGWNAKQPQILKIYESAKNSTEKAHALRVLHDFCDENQVDRVMNALNKGDETLRLEAASIIVQHPQDDFPVAQIQTAFDKEIWPETQIQLYQALTLTISSDSERAAFQKRLLLDPKRAESLRLTAFNHLVESTPNQITLDDMSALLKTEAPLELIASVSEHLYAYQPSSRTTLRTWIKAQQPFNRRLLATFVRFVNIDTREKDASAIDLVRSVCNQALEQENILQPCLHYMTDNAQTDEDRALTEKLQQRQNQIDAMFNLDFAL